MRILKAYTDAGALGGKNYGMTLVNDEAREKKQPKEQVRVSGDSIRISAEAQEMLENGTVSEICAHDATYDQYGNITRQVDALSRELASLGRAAYPANANLAGRINFLRSQLGTLRTQV